jgi:glycosyltransferase involved in cell wall biosynthesis
MTGPTFSVIVPTYGRPEFLSEALRSVEAQQFEDFECIVVDDASPTPTTIDPALGERFRIVRRAENGGPAAARNTGIDQSAGTAVCFLDDDDVWTAGRLSLAVEGLRRAPVAICQRQGLNSHSISKNALHGNVSDSILDVMTPHLGQTAVMREVAPRFDERFIGCQDVEWWLRLAKHADVTSDPRVGLLWRSHQTSRHRNGPLARVQGSQLLLELYPEYFREHPRAAAFRNKRIGLMALACGQRRTAILALAASLRLRPDVRTLKHLARALSVPRVARAGRDDPGTVASGSRD